MSEAFSFANSIYVLRYKRIRNRAVAVLSEGLDQRSGGRSLNVPPRVRGSEDRSVELFITVVIAGRGRVAGDAERE